jgi:hypothetical protein
VPSLDVTVGVPQASVAVALPRAASIADEEGLQPTASALPLVVMVGPVLSFDQITVLDAVAELPHTSVAIQVRVCDVLHPDVVCGPSGFCINVGVLQSSDAVAEPKA